MITIFTPVYNRADVIGKLYRSLLRQTSHDFEWLIVDDGSTDFIAEVVRGWMETAETPFKIRFCQQENGGKHRAINWGVQLAEGDAFFIVDSDDYLMDNAVEWIQDWWKDVEEDDSFAGIAALRGNEKGEIIGNSPLLGKYTDATNIEREKYGLLGDKAEIYKTSVLKKEPFPEIEGENFLTEAIVWDRIAHNRLKLRWFHEVIYICEYRADGLTSQGWKIFEQNPIGWGLYIQQTCQFYHLDNNEKTGRYLEYYIFMRGKLPNQDIRNNLGVDAETFGSIRKHHESCIEKTAFNIGKSLGVYGAGMRGKKVLKLYEGTGIHISFILDRKQADTDYRQIDLEDEYPKVDAVIVTPQNSQGEIFDFLAERTENRLIGYDEWKACIGLGGNF